MRIPLTLISAILVTSSCMANAENTAESSQAIIDPSSVLIDTPDADQSKPVPEPNGLVALAFAGVVILARHRFRP